MKSIQVYKHGVRVIRDRKGCNSCYDCVYLCKKKDYYQCYVRELTNSIKRRKFPYDNTTCEDFESKEQ